MLFLKSSLVFQRCTKAATSTAITATTATTGAEILPIAAPRVENAVFAPAIIVGIFETNVIMLPIEEIVLPITIKSGPKAAAINPILIMVCFVAGSRAFSLSTNPCILVIISRMTGIKISPNDIASSSSWDFKMVSCPARLSCMVSAIEREVPSQFAIAPDNLSISAGAAFIRAKNPDMAFLPTRVSAALAFSDSDIWSNATLQSAKISDKLRIEPSEFEVAISISPKAAEQNFTSPERAVIMERMEVPDCVDLIPAFAIKPKASAVSSQENPKAPAIGAQYLKDSPSMDTLVFALELAAANTSAKCPLSAAVKPKAVSASVTISEVVARSSPLAAARFMMPSMPDSISFVFQPAIAI